jgi:hypothetical protein
MPITRINSLQNRRFRPKTRFTPATFAFLGTAALDPLPRPLPFLGPPPFAFTATFAFYGAAL